MAKRDAPKQNKGGDNTDRKNGKAWKKVDGGARQRKTGRTLNGYSNRRIAEWLHLAEMADINDELPKLSKTKQAAVDKVLAVSS